VLLIIILTQNGINCLIIIISLGITVTGYVLCREFLERSSSLVRACICTLQVVIRQYHAVADRIHVWHWHQFCLSVCLSVITTCTLRFTINRRLELCYS